MKKLSKKLVLAKETLRHVRGAEPAVSDVICTMIGACASVPPPCKSNWVTHCEVNVETYISCWKYPCR